jgi:hypothetical protein
VQRAGHGGVDDLIVGVGRSVHDHPIDDGRPALDKREGGLVGMSRNIALIVWVMMPRPAGSPRCRGPDRDRGSVGAADPAVMSVPGLTVALSLTPQVARPAGARLQVTSHRATTTTASSQRCCSSSIW